MPKPKIKSKTKAANRAAKQLGYVDMKDCMNTGTGKHKDTVLNAFSNANKSQ